MAGVVGNRVRRGVQVAIGVDAHQDEHVVVAIDQAGSWSPRELFSSAALDSPG